MILRGILDEALGNFICFRGYAPMNDLHKISKSDPSYQRDLIKTQHDRMVSFLDNREYLFFPEVILGTFLANDKNPEIVRKFFEEFDSEASSKYDLPQFKLNYSVKKYKDPNDSRSNILFRSANLNIQEDTLQDEKKFHRIDGNHRLSVLDEVKGKQLDDEKRREFGNYNVPFCIILCNNETDLKRYSRTIFHNLNYKQIPITKEQNLKLILEDKETFDDEKLKEQFGISYLNARQVLNKWDGDIIPNINTTLTTEADNKFIRTYIVNSFELLNKKAIKHNVQKFKKNIGKINELYDNPLLIKSGSHGLLTTFTYYAFLKNGKNLKIFYNWVIENHIYHTKDIKAEELIKVFDCVLESRKRTIFVSMQFSEETKENYDAIKNAVDEINNEHQLDLQIREIRIDEFNRGYSYKIDDEILSLIEGCGYLIADLTYGNKNVYHEIGFLMGLNQGKELEQNNFILVFNEQLKDTSFNNDVGFNLKANKVLKVNGTNKLRTELKKQIEIYYKISS